MKKTRVKYLSISFFLLLWLSPVHSHSYDAHVHGEAEIYIVLEDSELTVEFHSPVINLTGFESQKLSESESETLATTLAGLQDYKTWFQIKGGQCSARKSESHSSYEKVKPTDDHGEKDTGNTHHNITAQLKFECQEPQSISHISISIKEKYPGVEKIKMQWIFDDKQGATIGVDDTVKIDVNDE